MRFRPLLAQAACQGARPNRYRLWAKNQIRRTTEEIRTIGLYDLRGLYEVNGATSVPADEGAEELAGSGSRLESFLSLLED